MDIIKEPEGILLSVENRDLTKEETKLLIEFITSQRRKNRIQKEKTKNKKQREIVKRKLTKI